MILSTSDEFTQGDQRSIHIQLINNKRRIKRGSKQRKKSSKSLIERAIYIFNTGNLNDYTHPKEIDPYWDIIYRQYEYLIYIEYMYRLNLKRNCLFLEDNDIASIIKDIQKIKMYKKSLLMYLMNFMNIMYGSVIQRRFYGWKYYIEDFVSKFNEVAVVNLTKLKFDPDRTRCSVYFYQAFWLSGLSITNKISDDIKRNEPDMTKNTNDPYQLSIEDDFDTLYDTYGSEAIDTYSTIDKKETAINTEITVVAIEEEAPEIIIENIEELTESISIQVYVQNEVQKTHEEVDFEISCTLKKVLHQLNINLDSIHSFSDKKISKLGRVIRKKIIKGEIVLQKNDKDALSVIFASPLLK